MPSTSSLLTNFLPQYWDTVLGENLYPNLYLYQFGTKRTLPRNFGKTINIPRLLKQNIITATTEGTPIYTCSISGQTIQGTLVQYAGAYKHSDILIMTALSDVIELSLIDIARDIAYRMDAAIRNALSGIGKVLCTNGGAILRGQDVAKAVVTLDSGDNPRPPDNHYPTVVRPEVVYDLTIGTSGSGQWIDVIKYTEGNVNRAYIGEVGRLYGARFVTSTGLKRQLSAAICGSHSYMFAPDAYYVTEINEMTAKTYVKQLGSSGTADPVNQVATVGAKVFFGTVPANWTAAEYRMVRLKNTTVGVAAAKPKY